MQKRKFMLMVYFAMVFVLAGYLTMEIKLKLESVSAVPLEEKRIAITFDDGPNPDYTADLLKGLKERGVTATFFLLGAQVEKYPKLVEQIAKEGHLIGTHSYQHVNLCNLTDEAAIEQVVKTNELIEEITGECPQFIRPPFGCWKKDLDYNTTMLEVLWDIDPLDWNTSNTDAIVKRVLKNASDGAIILLHDASQSSVDAALQIIDQLQKEGYLFVTVDELILN